MLGADPVITWVDETTGPHAVDYFLTGYFQVGQYKCVCAAEPVRIIMGLKLLFQNSCQVLCICDT